MPHESNAVITELTNLGINAARRLGFVHVLECSDRSEAMYLHVQRRETWFGFRVACHWPVHECSRDYAQFIWAAPHGVLQQETLGRALAEAVQHGGIAVADPAEVRKQIEAAEIQRADGLVVRDRQGKPCVWNAGELAWAACDGIREGAPDVTPMVKLSSRAACRIRHRLNHRARWSYDEFGAMRSSRSDKTH